jgi:hypothetical protein
MKLFFGAFAASATPEPDVTPLTVWGRSSGGAAARGALARDVGPDELAPSFGGGSGFPADVTYVDLGAGPDVPPTERRPRRTRRRPAR